MVSSIRSILLLGLLQLTASNNTALVNLTLLKDIIHFSKKFHQFQTIPILAAHRTLFEVEDFIHDLQTTYQRPIYILSKKIPNFYFRFRIYRESLVLVFFRGISDLSFDMADTYTRGMRLLSVLFVLTRPPFSQHEVYDIMTHIWNDNYMHGLLFYRDLRGQDHLITFDPYPEFRIKSLLDSYKVADVLQLKRNGNLRGYKIRTPVKPDLPRVFLVTDYNGHKKFKGYGYQLFMAFVKHMNATFEEYAINVNQTHINVVMKDILALIKNGEIEISLHPYTMRNAMEGVGSSYPIRTNDICIMIPMANEIPSYMYLWRPLQVSTWILLLFGTIYLAGTLMWIPPNPAHSRRREFGWSLLQSIGYMLNIATWEYSHNVTWRYFLVHKASWILGFLITSWYCALLESYLAATVFGSQIDSMEDLIASGLKILATHFDIEELQNMHDLPAEFKNLFVGTSVDSLAKHRTGFNTTYAYAISIDRWQFLNLQQQYSKRPIFRLSHICFWKHHLAFQQQYDSRLQYSLNFFILFAQQSGLLGYWERIDFKYALREGYIKLMMDSNQVAPLHGGNMRLAWEVLGIGLGISSAVFLMEVTFCVKLGTLLGKQMMCPVVRVAQRLCKWEKHEVNKSQVI